MALHTRWFVVLVAVLGCVPAAFGQQVQPRAWASNVIVPQCYRSSIVRSQPLRVTHVDVSVAILEQIATTTIDISVSNTSDSRQTAELLLPVPDEAAIRGFDFQGSAAEPTAELLKKHEAKRTFDSIVRKMKDPALLEFAGYNLVRTSVFPVEPKGEQKVRLTYEHLLTADGDRVDYVLPRSQSVTYDVPWKITVQIKSKRTVNTVYSPSHRLITTRPQNKTLVARIADDAKLEPGAFRLSYLVERGAVTASLFSYPDTTGDSGYFLLLAGLARANGDGGPSPIKRELTLVLDRSGSMRGEKIKQAREAALQVLEGIEDGESFNVIVYNDGVESFAPEPVIKDDKTIDKARAFVNSVRASGGTNLHGALVEALRPEPRDGVLPIVLFLTDGLPTVGVKSEQAIRDVASNLNPHERRVFTFGVGYDVNTPLLDKIAVSTRGFATFVMPGEDVEVKVSRVFRGLDGPVLASPGLQPIGPKGKPAIGRISDLLPGKLPDLYEGDQLILLGRYIGKEPLRFALRGNHRGEDKQFRFNFKVKNGVRRNAFVGRLWATRKIAQLTDQIRDLGATGKLSADSADPRLTELTDEVVRLSTEFGVLTEYTAFLAKEGTDLNTTAVLNQTLTNYVDRAVNTRSGIASINQEFNNGIQRFACVANGRNAFCDANMNRVAITTVQQVPDNAFYRRHGRWVDSRLVRQEKQPEPKRVVEFGSPEFMKLVWSLAKQGRQSSIALDGDILVEVDGQPILIKGTSTKQAQGTTLTGGE